MSNKAARSRKAKKTRAHIARHKDTRLVVFKTPRHIYGQVIQCKNGQSVTIASASTLDKEVQKTLVGNKVEQAKAVGAVIAQRASKAGLDLKVPFDRSGYIYHGRVQALAEAAREGGLID